MKEILDQTIPDSPYADGRLAGRSLRSVLGKELLRERLLTDPEFKKHHRELFYDLDFLRQSGYIYRAFGLRGPR